MRYDVAVLAIVLLYSSFSQCDVDDDREVLATTSTSLETDDNGTFSTTTQTLDLKTTTNTIEKTDDITWTAPTAWNSTRLYSWGKDQGDVNILDIYDEKNWRKYWTCRDVPINGQAGAIFLNERFHTIYVSFYSMIYCYLNE